MLSSLPAPRFSALLLASGAAMFFASACTTGGDGPSPSAVTPAATALSPFAAEVTWMTSSSAASPVSFQAPGGPASAVSPAGAPTSDHRVLLQGLAAATTYSYRVGDGTGFEGTGTFMTPAAPQGPFRVLFDNAHGEQAGNADWVIDETAPDPTPSNPGSEAAWSGAYSAWGYDLHVTGRYDVSSLGPGGAFTFGGGGASDLSNFSAVILPEPNNLIPQAELDALEAFVAAGGGALFIADHEGSDRDSDGWESWEVFNLLPAADASWGWQFDAMSFASLPANANIVDDAREPLLHGTFGDVAEVGFYGTNSLHIVPAANPRMRPILYRPNQSGNFGLLIAAGWYGAGRVVLVGDSSPADDGTANPGNSNIFDSWNDPIEDNAAFFLNSTAWLVDDGG